MKFGTCERLCPDNMPLWLLKRGVLPRTWPTRYAPPPPVFIRGTNVLCHSLRSKKITHAHSAISTEQAVIYMFCILKRVHLEYSFVWITAINTDRCTIDWQSDVYVDVNDKNVKRKRRRRQSDVGAGGGWVVMSNDQDVTRPHRRCSCALYSAFVLGRPTCSRGSPWSWVTTLGLKNLEGWCYLVEDEVWRYLLPLDTIHECGGKRDRQRRAVKSHSGILFGDILSRGICRTLVIEE